MSRVTLIAIRYAVAVYLLLLVVATHWPRLELPGQHSVPFGLDKWLHVLAFGALAAGIYLARPLPRLKSTLIWGGSAALAYCLLNEATQSFVPGRTFDLGDPLASMLGVLLATGFYLAFHVLRTPDTSYVAHARTMAALTLVSRVFGLLRDVALAFVFGFGWVFDAFAVAFLIPNLFRRLFGEGALAGAFVPHYAKLEQEDTNAAERFASITIGILWVVLATLAGVGFAIMFGLYRFGELDPRGQLTVTLTMLSIWYAPLVCVAAILAAMLQTHGRFALPSAMPIVLNLLIVAAAFIGHATVAAGDNLSTPLLVIVAVLIAGMLQVTVQTHALRREGVYIRFYRSTWGGPASADAARAMLRQWLPTAIGLAVFQINTLADSLIAMFFSGPPGETFTLFGRVVEYPMHTGAVAVLGASARLYEFPLGVFGIAVATAIYPAVSRLADRRAEFSELIREGLRLTVFIGLPASIGLMIVREPLSRAIYYQVGSIRPEDASRVAWVLLGYAPAIWAYSMNHILVRAFYARHDARTPMRISLVMVTLNVVLNLTLIWRLGAAGLAWSTSACAMLQTVILLRLVRRHVDAPVDEVVRRSWFESALASLGMAAVIGPLVWGLVPMVGYDAHWLSIAGLLVLAVLAGGATFAVTAKLLKMQELDWILSRRAPAARASEPDAKD